MIVIGVAKRSCSLNLQCARLIDRETEDKVSHREDSGKSNCITRRETAYPRHSLVGAIERRRHRISAYDARFLALASVGPRLVTEDVRLARGGTGAHAVAGRSISKQLFDITGSSKLFSELKRRNVYKVAVAYAVVAWLTIQAASIFLPAFDAPPWVIKLSS